MKKHLTALCLALATLTPSWADGTGIITLYGLQDYTVTSVSPNGKWAAGYFMNGAGSYFAFRWNLTTNETELLSGNDAMSMAYGVSNDGTVVGEYTDYSAYENGAGAMVAGYHKDGSWHALPSANGSSSMAIGATAMCISADGRWMGGQGGSAYQPVVWRDGEFFKALSNRAGAVYSITNDGTLAAGWAYKDANEVRFTSMWNVESGEATWLSERGNPFNAARMFTQDGRHLLNFSFNWEYLYDVTTQTNERVTFCASQLWNLQSHCVDDSLRIYSLETDMNQNSYGSVSMGNRAVTLSHYLDSLGVDYSQHDVMRVVAVNACSADGKVLSTQTISSDSYEHPMMILLDQNVATREPVALYASQPKGVYAAKLSWSEPINHPADLTGYNVYRNGTKVNAEPIATESYIDGNLAAGDYTYTVTAVYGDAESAQSAAAVITLSPSEVSAPRSLYARQKGYNSASLTWAEPGTNRVEKTYYDPEGDISAMGGGSNSFEFAIKYDKEEMALYDGYTISRVAFVPQSAQTAWEIKIYSGSTLVYSQLVTQELAYGKENIVVLDSPVAVSSLTDDVYCAIAVTVPSTVESNNVIGADFNHCVPGYSDLIHLASENEFYSMSEASRANSYVFDLSFAMSMILSAPDEAATIDEVSGYNVYMDGSLLTTTTSRSHVVGDVADGTHRFEVEAQYSDGRLSPRTSVALPIAANSDALVISDVNCYGDGNVTTFSWDVPVDNDEQTVGYSSDNYGQTIDYGAAGLFYRARSVYPASMFRGMGGYVIKQLRFYPVNDALFTFMLYKGDEQVAEIPVDEYSLNQWNTIDLETPIVIEDGAQYTFDIDCFDGSEDGGALAIDNMPTVGSNAVLSSTDEGASFDALTGTGVGNWMMDMVISDPNGGALPIDGYNIRIDNERVNSELVTDTHYTHTFGADADRSAIHRVYVDANYSLYGEVRGTAVFFTLQELANGIDQTLVADLRVHPNPAVNYVAVEGANVEEMSAYSLGGSLMGKTSGNRLDVSTYSDGLYILKIKADGRVHTVKLRVVRG